MDGGELGHRLQPLRAGTKVLYISGYVRDGLSDLERNGAIHFLAKPFTPDALQRKVSELLAG